MRLTKTMTLILGLTMFSIAQADTTPSAPAATNTPPSAAPSTSPATTPSPTTPASPAAAPNGTPNGSAEAAPEDKYIYCPRTENMLNHSSSRSVNLSAPNGQVLMSVKCSAFIKPKPTWTSP